MAFMNLLNPGSSSEVASRSADDVVTPKNRATSAPEYPKPFSVGLTRAFSIADIPRKAARYSARAFVAYLTMPAAPNLFFLSGCSQPGVRGNR